MPYGSIQLQYTVHPVYCLRYTVDYAGFVWCRNVKEALGMTTALTYFLKCAFRTEGMPESEERRLFVHFDVFYVVMEKSI